MDLSPLRNWQPPSHWYRVTTLDAHTGGEPLRIIISGFPDLSGDTILARRQYAREHYDHLRRVLMWEPRGHADMYGCLLMPPATPDGDVGVLFMHNEGFSTMCGHGIIGLVKAGVDAGLFPADGARRVVRIDTPAGRVTATAHLEAGVVNRVSFLDVASFLLERDLNVDVPGIGPVTCDIAFGGAFYAYVDADTLGLKLDAGHYRRLVEDGMRIKRAVMAQYDIVHPDGDADLNFLYGTIFVSRTQGQGVHSRNVCIFADGEVDRCPTGTGVSGRVAIHHARGELAAGEVITVESIIGSRFTGSVAQRTSVGALDAVVPEVSGSAYLTGRHEFFIDPDDPFRGGFVFV